MRLRTTAPPNAFFTLIPKRVFPTPLERAKTVKLAPLRRVPPR